MAGPSGTTPNLKLPYPLPDDNVDPPRDIGALATAVDVLGVAPIGSVLMWVAAASPNGWLMMLGQLVPAATYPQLAQVLGSSGGNITIPDMRDRFPIGAASNALGAAGGAASVALSTAQMPSHYHGGVTATADRSLSHAHDIATDTHPGHAHGPYGSGAGNTFLSGNAIGSYWLSGATGGAYQLWFSGITDPAGAHAHAGNSSWVDLNHAHGINAEGGNAAHENRPPFRALNFIIRAG